VLRTTALLPAIKRKYPKSAITWVTEDCCVPILEGNPLIDRVMAFDASTLAVLGCERFDAVYAMDKTPAATALGRTVRTEERFGFVLTDWGTLGAYSQQSEYALLLGIDDDLKFYRNEKTYQEYMAQALGLDWRRDEMILKLNQAEIDYAHNHLRRLGVIGDRPRPIIGLNTGVGTLFATKEWPSERFVQLAARCTSELDAVVTLLGGPQERKRNAEIKEKGGSLLIADAGTNHTLRQFAAIVSFCDVLVTSDTFAMHIGIALKRKIVALFGSTCQQEIDLYDRGVKIFKGLDCSPCYKKHCEKQDCMKAISTAEVFEHICNLLG
jgi:heptosyltransferase-2